ncbi:MAG: hypothetical protein CMI02_01995 [Oceanospirillaceae bacterium]|nr:hypothetical protein [Oceanospirillaceae bacterium]MBT10792.1 hypothetical protein [Oceanospirillaceae bacterium]|tara:strand:+ start:12257 stop:13006 length:750 start_codon:yes stop_codon:yes gene_type:complete
MANGSGNPTLRASSFSDKDRATDGNPMTLSGTVNKTFILLALVFISGGLTWDYFLKSGGSEQFATIAGISGAVGGLVFALITIFVKRVAPYTAPLYALFEGLVIGIVSVIMEMQFPGIVLQAIGLTFGTMLSLLVAYKSGVIKVTQNFRLGVVAATGGIALVYIANFVMGFFGIHMPFIHESGTMGILFSLFVVVIAALNLVLDFDFIEQGVESGCAKYMEWYGAFGLVVTLLWLYIEILRLLAKARSR